MTMPHEEREAFLRAYGRVIRRAWNDAAFKQRLLADPARVLREEGVAVPEGIEARVLEDTERVRHFILPRQPEPEPAEEELSIEELDRAAGGVAQYLHIWNIR